MAGEPSLLRPQTGKAGKLVLGPVTYTDA